MIDFSILSDLSGGASVADVACPLCGPSCKAAWNRIRKVLRIWNEDSDFITYTCARCGASGYAKPEGMKLLAPLLKPKSIQAKPQAKDKTEAARALWRRSVSARGTIVETYLRSRQCWVDTETVRFLPPRGEHLPALIVPFGIPSEPEPGVLDIAAADIYGVQLTKLKPDGSGKADVEPNKITLGRCVGSPIVLASPSDMVALTIAEGVEDALSNRVISGRGAWSAGGAGRMPPLADAVPLCIESVTIMVDDNDAGRRGSNELAQRLHARGVEVLLLPSGGCVDAA
jgi:hypothetical protein